MNLLYNKLVSTCSDVGVLFFPLQSIVFGKVVRGHLGQRILLPLALLLERISLWFQIHDQGNFESLVDMIIAIQIIAVLESQ